MPNLTAEVKPFIPALKRELEWACDHFDLQPETIYFGGGTPSALSVKQLEELFDQWPWRAEQVSEFTMECNPETITKPKAQLLKEVGVNRISLGVQAFDDVSLKLLGRKHNKACVERTVDVLRQVGMENINFDLMFALPGQELKVWRQSLQAALALHPQHISCYNLDYEEDTKFFEKFKKGEFSIDENQQRAFFGEAEALLHEHGFEHYEISNYARKNFHSQHNLACWRGADYIGLGPSACSTVGLQRWKNISNTSLYAASWNEKGTGLFESEQLTKQLKTQERIILGLRTREGISRDLCADKTGTIADLNDAGLIDMNHSRLSLTTAGRLVADSITELLI